MNRKPKVIDLDAEKQRRIVELEKQKQTEKPKESPWSNVTVERVLP